MLLTQDLEALDRALDQFGANERGCYVHCALFDLDARTLMLDQTKHVKARQAIRHIHRHLWNASTIISRLKWMNEAVVKKELETHAWRSYCSLDIDHYFVQLRSAMDHSCVVFADFLPKGGQLPKSFEKLKNSRVKLADRVPEDVWQIIDSTKWFDEVRAVRNALVHEGGSSLVFCEPDEGVAMFQVYTAGHTPLIARKALMYNEHVVRFQQFAAWSMAHFMTYLNALGLLFAPAWPHDPSIGISQSSCFGFDTLQSWMMSLRENQMGGAEIEISDGLSTSSKPKLALPSKGSPDAAFAPLLVEVERIGRGTSRDVYSIADWPDIVLKVALPNCSSVNKSEVDTYTNATDPQRSVLGEIKTWSENFEYIVMERLTALSAEDQMDWGALPPQVTDRTRKNLGKDAAGRIKMLDYALTKELPNPLLGDYV